MIKITFYRFPMPLRKSLLFQNTFSLDHVALLSRFFLLRIWCPLHLGKSGHQWSWEFEELSIYFLIILVVFFILTIPSWRALLSILFKTCFRLLTKSILGPFSIFSDRSASIISSSDFKQNSSIFPGSLFWKQISRFFF